MDIGKLRGLVPAGLLIGGGAACSTGTLWGHVLYIVCVFGAFGSLLWAIGAGYELDPFFDEQSS